MQAGGRRIAYQLVAPLEKTLGASEVLRRRDYLQRHTGSSTIEMLSVAGGYPSIESERDTVVVSAYLLASLQAAAAAGAAAGIMGCFSDPALDAVRETVRMPVVGAGQSAIHLALQLGDRYGVLTPLESGRKRLPPRLRAMNVEGRLAVIEPVGVSVLDFVKDHDNAFQRVQAAGRACIAAGADVIVMGCMSMAFMGIDAPLARALGVPVVNPVLAALKTAEMLLDLGLTHSSLAWPAPPEKTYLT